MDKNSKNTKDKSTPYRYMGLGKVSAPTKCENEPKCRVIKGTDDLRCKGGKA